MSWWMNHLVLLLSSSTSIPKGMIPSYSTADHSNYNISTRKSMQTGPGEVPSLLVGPWTLGNLAVHAQTEDVQEAPMIVTIPSVPYTTLQLDNKPKPPALSTTSKP